jgi:phage terminase large subunit-like protein
MGLESIPKSVLSEAVQIGAALKRLKETNKLTSWKPYPKQLDWLYDHHKTKVLLGGNQIGKTSTASYEVALHLTGKYPNDWKGIRFDHPIEIWVAGVTAARVRDTLQEKLFGPIGQTGTGFIPLDCIDKSLIIMKPGIPHAMDRAQIKHASGGLASIQFFSYKQGMEDFMGSTVTMILFDEEPPADIYGECRMRLMVRGGYMFFTFTPLQGVTELYDGLIQDENAFKTWIAVDEVPHIDQENLERSFLGMSEYDIKARKYGIATVGTGKVFQFEETEYVCEDFEIPRHWRKISGLDVGLSHPTAAVSLAIDDESGCYYIFREYCQSGSSPRQHCTQLSMWNTEFAMDPTAWNRQIGSQASVAKMYQDEGLRVFKAFHDVDPSITKIRMLISEGRFWIFQSLSGLLKELRTYRTREGNDGKQKIIKILDDEIDAMRYAVMASAKASISGKGNIKNDIKVVEWRPSSSSYGY